MGQAYAVNLDKQKSVVTHWIALYVNGDNVTYFDKFKVKHIPKEIKIDKIDNKNIIPRTYRI